MTDPFESQRVQLINDLKMVVSDVQSMVHAASSDEQDGSVSLKQSVSAQLGKVLDRLHRMEAYASEKLAHTAIGAQTYVQAHPLQAIGLSAGLGLLVGLLARRR